MIHDDKAPTTQGAGRRFRLLAAAAVLLGVAAPLSAQYYSPIDRILKQANAKSPVNSYANAPSGYGYGNQPPARTRDDYEDRDPRYDRGQRDYDDIDRSLRRETVHVVESGETLNGVADRAGVSANLIIEANRLPSPYYLYVGQRLIIPRARTHVVQQGETGFDIAYRYGLPYSEIAVANNLSPDSYLRIGQVLRIPTVTRPTPRPAPPAQPQSLLNRSSGSYNDGYSNSSYGNSGASYTNYSGSNSYLRTSARFTWPVDGRVRRRFTARTRAPNGGDYHDGIDIIAQQGTAVRAITGGYVTFAGREPDSYGNTVVVQHDGGWVSVYSFLDRITVRQGDRVNPRERVGLVGHTGRATRDELHFELRRGKTLVDPLNYLPPRDLNPPADRYRNGY
ncbi:LysM peptidoglycan-binding domain-containing protein [Novosphingobium umbonatum]|uniref:LysM peptidoglycan-binding domain-containing protein n=1 Tax=Novosphingobium umbonatum TaxID=1908524 RepID=A0A3S2UTY9_9SPHN|nr:LysM peptidoglycan-binding domain-containing M23 family metallopeptidase [Novosphingobium umbonatum]RVU06872.1 LysM peptidoglycan-binding domain-containing protein [Novosphingobium umbonatum]